MTKEMLLKFIGIETFAFLSQCQMNKYQSGTNAGKLETIGRKKKEESTRTATVAKPTSNSCNNILLKSLSSGSFLKVKRIVRWSEKRRRILSMKYNCHAGFGSISFNLAIQSKQDSGYIESKWNTHTHTYTALLSRCIGLFYFLFIMKRTKLAAVRHV